MATGQPKMSVVEIPLALMEKCLLWTKFTNRVRDYEQIAAIKLQCRPMYFSNSRSSKCQSRRGVCNFQINRRTTISSKFQLWEMFQRRYQSCQFWCRWEGFEGFCSRIKYYQHNFCVWRWKWWPTIRNQVRFWFIL